jgi:uridine kinase
MKKPLVIGIAGESAGGKSTFSDYLEKSLDKLKVKVMRMDNYFKSDEDRPRPKAMITKKVYLDDNHPESMDLPKLADDLRAAANGKEHDVIIVEGLLTLYDDDICTMLDLKLYVECRPDERIVRRLKRNMQWGLSFDEISGVYLDMVRYRHDEYVEPSKWRADFILNGSNFSDKALLIISEYIKREFS